MIFLGSMNSSIQSPTSRRFAPLASLQVPRWASRLMPSRYLHTASVHASVQEPLLYVLLADPNDHSLSSPSPHSHSFFHLQISSEIILKSTLARKYTYLLLPGVSKFTLSVTIHVKGKSSFPFPRVFFPIFHFTLVTLRTT